MTIRTIRGPRKVEMLVIPGRLFAFAVATSAAVACSAARAGPIVPLNDLTVVQFALPTMPVVDRPEIRSYQPYSGLQFNFSPTPPVQRGVQRKRPKIVAPKRVEPLIEYGPSRPYSSGGYAYCVDRPGQIEPRDGPYGGQPLGQRTCP
jgi:hypothetical protein